MLSILSCSMSAKALISITLYVGTARHPQMTPSNHKITYPNISICAPGTKYERKSHDDADMNHHEKRKKRKRRSESWSGALALKTYIYVRLIALTIFYASRLAVKRKGNDNILLTTENDNTKAAAANCKTDVDIPPVAEIDYAKWHSVCWFFRPGPSQKAPCVQTSMHSNDMGT